VRGDPEQIPALLLGRFGDVIDRISLYMPYDSGRGTTAKILAGLRDLR